MKILVKAIFIVTIYLLAAVVSGCFLCNCPDARYTRYQTTSLKNEPILYVFNHDEPFDVIHADTSRYAALTYGIALIMSIEKFAFNHNKFSFFSTAYACKCMEYSIYPRHQINKIKVITVHDFDSLYPSGADVTALFKIPFQKYNPLEVEKIDFSEYNLTYTFEDNDAIVQYIFLDAVQESSRKVQFKIELTFTDGTSFSSLVPEVWIDS